MDEVKSLYLLTTFNTEVLQIQERTYLQRLLHSVSAVLMKHPPTHYMPRGTTDCFVVR